MRVASRFLDFEMQIDQGCQSFRRILLTQCYFTIVDGEDFEVLNQVPWCVLRSRDGRRQYAMRRSDNRHLFMHRVITGAPKGLDVDHINGNGLDNRRANLRICTRSQNLQNKPRRPGTSRFKGVSWNVRDHVWYAYVNVNKSVVSLGSFQDEVEAARTYDAAALKHFGPQARLNFPDINR
ncbi:MAG: endonuclease [Alphaproteobacteria bacterium]|nr:endonuclease [Alphaproteobacteria bacterium]